MKKSECVTECNGQWLQAAYNLLQSNETPVRDFVQAIYVLLEKGRGKNRNLYIHGPANCGKTFILSPLKLIYKTFSNPATGTFAWVGAEDAEIIMLNDFSSETVNNSVGRHVAVTGKRHHSFTSTQKFRQARYRTENGHAGVRNRRCSYCTDKRWSSRCCQHRDVKCKMENSTFLAANSSRRTTTFGTMWTLFRAVSL